MQTVSVAEAKGYLSALLARVEHGEQVIITRHGRVIAKISQSIQDKKPLDFSKIDAFRESLPLSSPSATLIRKMRDSGY